MKLILILDDNGGRQEEEEEEEKVEGGKGRRTEEAEVDEWVSISRAHSAGLFFILVTAVNPLNRKFFSISRL